jgi:hypothetical protein
MTGYHLGRAAHHLGRACLAFAPIAILGAMLLSLGLLLFLLTGCSSGPGKTWWNPATWRSAKEATAHTAAQTETARQRDALLKEAQKATHETGQALAAAPESRPVAVASESNQSATQLLDQALGSLPLDEQARLRERVAALLSENEAIRTAAERERTTARATAAELSRLYETARAAEIKATADLAAAFARENALADKHRNAELQKWAGYGFSALMTALALYLKFNPASVSGEAIGKALAFADRDAPHKATAARDILDPYINRNEQAAILAHVVKTAAKIR